jgi:hypothetical protein
MWPSEVEASITSGLDTPGGSFNTCESFVGTLRGSLIRDYVGLGGIEPPTSALSVLVTGIRVNGAVLARTRPGRQEPPRAAANGLARAMDARWIEPDSLEQSAGLEVLAQLHAAP